MSGIRTEAEWDDHGENYARSLMVQMYGPFSHCLRDGIISLFIFITRMDMRKIRLCAII